MAVSHGKNARIWVNELDISGYSNAFTLSVDVDTVDVTTFADAAHAAIEGDYGFTLSFEAFMDNTDAGVSETLYLKMLNAAGAQTGGVQYVLIAPAGVAQGTEGVYELMCLWQGQPHVVAVGDAVKISGTLVGSGSGSLSRGYVLQNETVTATGAEAGYNIGAVTASTKTTVATYRIVSITGDMVWDVEESQNDGGGDAYAAVAAFASGTLAAAGVTRKTTTGALEAWRRVNVTNAPTTAVVLVTHTICPNI